MKKKPPPQQRLTPIAQTIPAPLASPSAAGFDETLESQPDGPVGVKPKPPPNQDDTFAESDGSRYEFAGELGRGGMGRIIIARDRRLRRPVALKELLAHDRQESIKRFEREALITAKLSHPSIVRLYEAGKLPTGQPFFALEMVRGSPFDKVIQRCKSLNERLALLPHMLAACDALAYAHSQRVIHRDLKPQNVLCGSFGETVVIDWGLAKDLLEPDFVDLSDPNMPTRDPSTVPDRADDTEPESYPGGDSQRKRKDSGRLSDLTMAGAVMGTPTFMPPEQARGEPADERSDVYALGAMLYTLLAGAPPYRGRTSDEVLDLVMRGPPTRIEERAPGSPSELCAIVHKAMAWHAKDRYPNAGQLADELRRFHTGQLVAAHVYTRRQLIGRWLRKHRGPVAVGAVAATLLLTGGTLSIVRILHERDRARVAETEANKARTALEQKSEDLVLDQARAALDRDPTAALGWLKELAASTKRGDEALDIAKQALNRGVARILRGHKDDVNHLRRIGDKILSGSDDHKIRLWDRNGSWQELAGHTAQVSALAVSPDGKTAASGSVDQNIRIWNLASLQSTVLAGHHGTIRELAFSPDGASLASASEDHTVRVWELATGKSRVLTFHTDTVRSVAYGRRNFASCGVDGKVALWNLTSGTPRLLGTHKATCRLVRLSPDENLLVSASEDGAVNVWDVESGKLLHKYGSDRDLIRDAHFSPDGKWLAAVGGEMIVRLWNLESGEVMEWKGHEGGLKSVVFSPDGKWVASGGSDTVIRLWNMATGKPRLLRGHRAAVKALEFMADGTLVSASDDDTVRLWLLDEKPPPNAGALRDWLNHLVPWRVMDLD